MRVALCFEQFTLTASAGHKLLGNSSDMDLENELPGSVGVRHSMTVKSRVTRRVKSDQAGGRQYARNIVLKWKHAR